jgi:hypothetical protein
MCVIEQIKHGSSRRVPLEDEPSNAERGAISDLAARKSLAVLRRYEVETDEIIARIRDRDERRKTERLDQWILFTLIAVAVISLLATDQKQWPYLSPAFLTAGALFRLVWATRRRGGPPDTS